MKRKEFYRFITIALFSILLAACAQKAETEPLSGQTPRIAPGEAMAQAENLFRGREDVAKLREAVRILASARDVDNRNFEIEWQFARFNYFLGKQTGDEKESEKALADGIQAGKIAARIEPGRAEGHFWYGANLGEQARKSPVTVGIKSIGDIREAMNKVVEIEPGYQSASAYVALGQVELKAGVLGGGKPEKAVDFLEKALEISTENPYAHFNLGEAYLASGRKTDARKRFEHLLKMKPNPEYAVEYKECSEKAKKLLETRF